MIAMARCRRGDADFVVANAEDFGHADAYDVATIMFALHEMPAAGRAAVLQNALRIARSGVLIVDIAPHYTPSDTMRSGEPYVDDYLRHIDDEVRTSAARVGWVSSSGRAAKTLAWWWLGASPRSERVRDRVA